MSDDLGDFLESIGLDVKPTSPEKALLNRLDGGTGYRPIHNFRFWLRHEIFTWFDIVERGMPPCKKVVSLTHGDRYEPATRQEYVAIRIKNFLLMQYHPWFDPTYAKDRGGMSGIGVCNIDTMVALLLSHELIAPLLTAKKEDMPRNI
jgi:hypothetical protein